MLCCQARERGREGGKEKEGRMLRDTRERERDRDREKWREKEFMRCFASLVKKEKKREEEEKGMKMKKGIVTEKK